MTRLRACLAAASLAALPHLAAQDLRGGADPTRPPSGVLPPGITHAPSALEALLPPKMPAAPRASPGRDSPAGASSAEAATAGASGASAPARPRNRLTSVSLGDGVRAAIVDGKLKRVGERVGAAVLQSIDAEGVTLLSDKGMQRLWLHPTRHPPSLRAQAVAATDTEGDPR